MKATFNGACDGCGNFMPRCATIHIKPSWRNRDVQQRTQIRREECRRKIKGSYILGDKHK